MKKTFEQFLELLEDLSERDIVRTWNEIAWADYGRVNELYDMDFLDDNFYGTSLSDFLQKIDKNNFSYSQDYYYWERDTWLVSTDNYRDVVDIDELAGILWDEWDYFSREISNQEIQDFFEELEEETDEEEEA
jgi:hypothetical protein